MHAKNFLLNHGSNGQPIKGLERRVCDCAECQNAIQRVGGCRRLAVVWWCDLVDQLVDVVAIIKPATALIVEPIRTVDITILVVT